MSELYMFLLILQIQKPPQGRHHKVLGYVHKEVHAESDVEFTWKQSRILMQDLKSAMRKK